MLYVSNTTHFYHRPSLRHCPGLLTVRMVFKRLDARCTDASGLWSTPVDGRGMKVRRRQARSMPRAVSQTSFQGRLGSRRTNLVSTTGHAQNTTQSGHPKHGLRWLFNTHIDRTSPAATALTYPKDASRRTRVRCEHK